tara:strand:- start:547 stop:1599 length:1053 start_codon:yes stop_codon:yes gene_type:complete
MKKIIVSIFLLFFLSVANVYATYTFVVPQKPGAGTTVWTELIVSELQKYLDEDIVIKMIPGARDIPGFNEFHNSLQYDDKTVMVSHGGNGVSFLQEQVDYNYKDYESIGLQNLNIIAGKLKGDNMEKPVFAAGSGMVPEAFSMTLLTCGPNMTVDQYIKCFKENVTWVSGMSGAERRLAFKRGELNGTRENPVAYKKHVISDSNAEMWFHHGILNPDTGTHSDDINYPGYQLEILFEKKWGVPPSGDFYDAYKLVKSFRDGLQKAIWIKKDSLHKAKLVKALTDMVNNKQSMDNLIAKTGNYKWYIGKDGDKMRDTLLTFVTEKALKNLVHFNNSALGLDSIYKSNLVNE